MPEFLDACRTAARIGGEQLERFRDSFRASQKGINDLVTDADLASQRAIHDYLNQHFPEHGFVGEEDIRLAMASNSDSEFRWIVDPLDGTLNYVHQLQSWSVSIALQKSGVTIAGAVYDPWLDELYSAAAGENATLNDRPIQTSGCDSIGESLLVVSLPANVTRETPEIRQLIELLCGSRSVRRLGSAALNLCYIATGRVDGYWATSLNLWDIAAGWLILNQAGGRVQNPQGGPVDPHQPRLVAAATPSLADQITALLKNHDEQSG